MTTFTWDSLQTPFDWTDPNDWFVGTINPAGPPGTGDTAIVGGTISLEQSLHDMTVQMPVTTDTVEIVATNVDLGDNFNLVITNPDDDAGFDVYKVVGTGTLDDQDQTGGLTPKAGVMDLTVHGLTIDLATGASFTNDGSIFGDGLFVVTDGASTGTFVNNETISLTGGFVLGAGATLTGSGMVSLVATDNGNFEIDGTVGAGETLAFTGPDSNNTQFGSLNISDISTFQGTVVLTQGNEVVISDMESKEQSYSGGVLTFANGDTLKLQLADLAVGVLVLAGGGSTTVFAEETACFAAGTRIATLQGDRPVETLGEGDMVRLARGGSAVVRWVGHRQVNCTCHPRPHDVRPIQVRAGAFTANQPARDLYLSPDHAVFVAGALIPVRYLVNGATVTQTAVESVTYWHVELDRHEVILAEGLACESYLDTGNRAAFANAGATQLHPDFGPVTALGIWGSTACAPLVLEGPRLAAARARLSRRATALGARPSADPDIAFLADDVPIGAEREGGTWTVRLPAGTRTLRLRSRTWVPAHMRPDDADTRALGVAIGRLWRDGLAVSLDSPGLAAGWHAAEPDWRWTDGDARIDVAGARVMRLMVAMTGRYWATHAPGSTEPQMMPRRGSAT